MDAQPEDWAERLAAAAERAGHGGQPLPLEDMPHAPESARRIAASIARMDNALAASSQTMAEHATELAEARGGQQAMAREMNHRVRNNLQIISSFLNLQADALPADFERMAIERTRLRVAAVALVHRLIFDRGDQTTVASGALIDAICALITDSVEAPLGFDVDCSAQQHPVPIDTAVPMALWMVEAVEVIAKRGSQAPDAQIAISLEAPGNELKLAVRGSGLGDPVSADPVPDRLLDALARQMGTRMERRRPTAAEEEISLNIRLDHAEQDRG